MYFLALATDYDGTLAHDGVVASETMAALRHLKAAGRRLILVTGRELDPLRQACPDLDLFDRIVVENGALLYDPATGAERLLAPPPSRALVERLTARGVGPISVGRGIIATWEPHQTAVLDAIRELGQELQIVFNKGAIMILAPGVNKASGLMAALADLDISVHNVVGVGDAENDHAFLRQCGCAAAVANALPSLKAEADIVLAGDHGAGVAELAAAMVARDAALATSARHGIRVGQARDGAPVHLEPHSGSVLIIGGSGTGKSTLATALTEGMAEKRFEFCVVDPEGDYVDLEHAVCLGSNKRPPPAAEAVKLLHDDAVNLVINTQALAIAERRELFQTLLAQAGRLRARSGRPHWMIIDEAHQMLPRDDQAPRNHDDEPVPAAILVTAYPHSLAAAALAGVETVIVLGPDPSAALRIVAERRGVAPPEAPAPPGPGEAVMWRPDRGEAAFPIKFETPRQVHRRHCGKYAVGDVGQERSFYFREPDGRLNRPARNLYSFVDIMNAVDDACFEHHLRAGDFSAWFRHVIRDSDLAAEAERIERDRTHSAEESRRLLRKAIWRRYAGPGAS